MMPVIFKYDLNQRYAYFAACKLNRYILCKPQDAMLQYLIKGTLTLFDHFNFYDLFSFMVLFLTDFTGCESFQ